MKLAAAVCWYDEPIEHLRRVVASVAPLVDSIVAYDGAWRGFPQRAEAKSQVDAMREILEDARIDHLVTDAPRGVWESQSAKRTALYRAASEDADWVLVIDADEELRCDDPQRLRSLIRVNTHLIRPDAMMIRVATPGLGKGGGDTATAPGGVRWQPRLLRADASLTVGPYSHRTITTSTAIIQCENEQDKHAHNNKHAGMIGTLHSASIINRTHARSAERIAAKIAYGKARAHRGID